MNEAVLKNGHLLIENRNHIRNQFSWDSGLLQLAGAGIFTMKDKKVDEVYLEECKQLLKQNTGILSNFRSTVKLPVICMLAASGEPKRILDKALQIYELLKKEFWTSEYLPFAAMIIAESAQESEFERIVLRTRELYNRMKSQHPFLTSSEDSAFCALLAMSEKSDEQLIDDAEACYQILSGKFLSSNAIQSLTYVLAICDGVPEEKCRKTMNLFNKLKEAGHKYGTSYELPTLGVLAMSGENADEIAVEIIEADSWLADQKGFGFFGGISGKQRLMYAGMLVQKNCMKQDSMQAAAISGTISMIIAQQAAMCAAIAASSAAAANSSSN